MFFIDVDFRGLPRAGDYMQFRCAACQDSLGVSFKGMDGSIPLLRFKCNSCGNDEVFKIQPSDFWGLGSTDGDDPLDDLERAN